MKKVKKRKCYFMYGHTGSYFLIQRHCLSLRGDVTVIKWFLCFTELELCFRDRYVIEKIIRMLYIICMVWQAVNF